jgi:hypothetical protein
MGDPVAARAHLPAGYGLPAGSPTLPWAAVDERLRDAMHYWIATVGDDGAPTVRPIDGMWLDNARQVRHGSGHQRLRGRGALHVAAPGGAGVDGPLRGRDTLHLRVVERRCIGSVTLM